MGKITVEEMYRGEKYGIMRKVLKELNDTYRAGDDAKLL